MGDDGGGAGFNAVGFVGREIEREAIVAMLAQTRAGSGSTLEIEGPPGIGKSALLEWSVGSAHDFCVPRTRARPDGDARAYAGIVDLLGSCRHAYETMRPRGALRNLLGPRDHGTPGVQGPIDPLIVGVELTELFSDFAVACPTLVVIDDAHWLDPSSASALAFVARRIEGDAIAILAASRTGEKLPSRDLGLPTLDGATDAQSRPGVSGGMRKARLPPGERMIRADPDEARHVERVVPRNANVAGSRERQACAGADAVHRGDDRLLERADQVDVHVVRRAE